MPKLDPGRDAAPANPARLRQLAYEREVVGRDEKGRHATRHRTIPEAGLRVGAGWLAGTDAGEWGGEVVLRSDDGATRLILRQEPEGPPSPRRWACGRRDRARVSEHGRRCGVPRRLPLGPRVRRSALGAAARRATFVLDHQRRRRVAGQHHRRKRGDLARRPHADGGLAREHSLGRGTAQARLTRASCTFRPSLEPRSAVTPVLPRADRAGTARFGSC
jgi:hypothetical protein